MDEYKGEKRILNQNALVFYKIGEEHAIVLNEKNSIHFTFVMTEEAYKHYIEKYDIDDLVDSEDCVFRQLTDVQGSYLTTLARGVHNSLQCDELERYIRMYVMNALTWLSAEETSPVRCIDQYTEDLVNNLNHFRLLNCYIKDIYRRYPVANSALIANFKKYTRYTIVQYVGKKRMEYAAQLLATKQYSVTQISNMLNLTSVSYFTKKFKEQFGVTPSQYKRVSKNILYHWTEDVEYGFDEREQWDRMMIEK